MPHDCDVEAAVAVTILCIDVGTVLDQVLDDGSKTTRDGEDERCLVLLVIQVNGAISLYG